MNYNVKYNCHEIKRKLITSTKITHRFNKDWSRVIGGARKMKLGGRVWALIAEPLLGVRSQ